MEVRRVTAAEYGERPVAMLRDEAVLLGLVGDFHDDDDLYDFWRSSQSLKDDLRDTPWPDSVFGCDEIRMNFDARDIVDAAFEQAEMHDGAFDLVMSASLDELQALLDAWAEKHTEKIVSYVADHYTCVVEALLEPKVQP